MTLFGYQALDDKFIAAFTAIATALTSIAKSYATDVEIREKQLAQKTDNPAGSLIFDEPKDRQKKQKSQGVES